MNRIAWIALVLVGMLASSGAAADWGGVVPGESTTASVKAQYGEPTESKVSKVDGYDVTQWIYESGRSPRGMKRMAIDFGLLTESGFRPDVVRVLTLEPLPVVFTRQTVLLGWGAPARVGQEAEGEVFFYQEGLLVEFDKQGWLVRRMTFTLRQPKPPE